MSGPMPKNYVLESIGIAIVLIIIMVLFLKSSWGH